MREKWEGKVGGGRARERKNRIKGGEKREKRNRTKQKEGGNLG